MGFVFGRSSGDFLAVTDAPNVNHPAPPPPPKPTAAPKIQPKAEKNIVLEVPVEGAALAERFAVSGRARVFENNVEIEVKDADGKVLLKTFTTAVGEAGQFGRFETELALPDQQPGEGTVEVYWTDVSDGTTRDRIIRKVIFAPGGAMPIKVFFGSSALDPDAFCDRTFPVIRFAAGGGSIYRSALEALLAGPTAAEKAQGYFSSLPPGVKLKSVVNDASGTVTADFNTELKRVAGSCRVSAIAAQIKETLKQFPETRDVVISVEGKTEDVLQP
ncbi:GerMN domain-containing protein [Candidatus Uhrbacteria bacterium]|nr:GerMN domain-containing protein [Candidatus Uhrbacteria bacterium]